MFEIKTNSTHINIYISLGGGKKKKISLKKIIRSDFYKSLNDYKYVLNNLPNLETSDKFQDAIWILWFQGKENAPEIVKKCIDSVRHFHSDKQIIVLDLYNLKNYIEIPNYIQEKYEKGIIPHANFSDYIRLCLLAKYGGTWIDSTVLLTDKIPDKIFMEKLFFSKSANNFDDVIENIKEIVPQKKKFRFFPKKLEKTKSISSWFIHTVPNNKVILATLYFFNEYWKKENELKHYFMFHSFVRYCFENDVECSNFYEQMYSIPHKYAFLLHEFGKTKYNKEIFDKIISMSCIHKLTYRYLEKQDQQWLDRVYNLDFNETKGKFQNFSI